MFIRKHFHNTAQVIHFLRTQLQGSGAPHGYRWTYNKCSNTSSSIDHKVHGEDVRLILSTLDRVGQPHTGRRLRSPNSWVQIIKWMEWFQTVYNRRDGLEICMHHLETEGEDYKYIGMDFHIPLKISTDPCGALYIPTSTAVVVHCLNPADLLCVGSSRDRIWINVSMTSDGYVLIDWLSLHRHLYL